MTAFLFPGQGSQVPGMGKDFYDKSPVARERLDQAAEILGSDFLDVLFGGSADDLRHTQRAQPALVAVGVAIASHLRDYEILAETCAGHSVGEIAALTVAGHVKFVHAIALTRERARLMAEETPPGTMAAVIGLAAEAIEKAAPEGVEIANLNSPDQTIISGTHEGIENATALLKEAGAKRVLPLNVSGPFHSSLMQPAVDKFAEFLQDIPFMAGEIPVVSSVTGHQIRDFRTIPNLLAQQLSAPVRWVDVMRLLGPVPALEVGPGSVLQGLARRTPDAPKVQPAGTLEAATNLTVAPQ